MKSNTIKWRIFKYNILVFIIIIALVAVVFNVAIRIYIEKQVMRQLHKIASHTTDIAIGRGADFFPQNKQSPPPPPPTDSKKVSNAFRYYFMLDRSLREPLSVLNADFILLDSKKNLINPFSEQFFNTPADLMNKITNEIGAPEGKDKEKYLNINVSGTEYVAIIKPVSQKNSFGLGWIVIYSSLQNINQLQIGINVILFCILLFSALVIVIFSSIVSKKVTAPFSVLNQHVSAIAERNFGTKIEVPVYDELQELVGNFNIMSEKLEAYDKAQKTFLQNASHEFRTPLMSIQSYAEGIKYDVTDSNTAAEIIIDESKRLTHLVEELLYLSRLDAIEENYRFNTYDFNDMLRSCVERMRQIAVKEDINISCELPKAGSTIYADEEKLSRAITNVISNCIRYAKSKVSLTAEIAGDSNATITISDDGPGFEANDLPNIFERFYKGKKGIFGLGLAISKNVIEKHGGKISAGNTGTGAFFKIELPLSA